MKPKSPQRKSKITDNIGRFYCDSCGETHLADLRELGDRYIECDCTSGGTICRITGEVDAAIVAQRKAAK